jgi:hypothetical protein
MPFSRPEAWIGRSWWAGPTERSSRRTGPDAIRIAPGSRGDEQERIRTSLKAVTARNANIDSVKVAGNHGAILRKDSPAIAQAVREVAALDGSRRTTRQPASEQGPQS